MDNILEKLVELDEYLWGRDVPSPCCPEYVELHDIVSTARAKLESIILDIKINN